jgi:ribosomal protein L7/L12
MNMVIQETAKLMEQQKQQFNSQLVTMTKAAAAAAAAAAANTQEIQDNHNKDQPDSQPIR